jgi:hypothetical protein
MHGPLHRFFGADHRRLDALLRGSIAEPGRVDPAPFGEFQAGILRHIGMEEKVLFVAARRARGGEPPEGRGSSSRPGHHEVGGVGRRTTRKVPS